MKCDIRDIADRLDHTKLSNFSKSSDVIAEAVKCVHYRVRGFVVYPFYVPVVRKVFDEFDADTKLVSVVSFPSGSIPRRLKKMEIEEVYSQGADEVDVVINIDYLLSNDLRGFEDEINYLIDVSHALGLTIKGIVEVTVLNKDILEDAIAVINRTDLDYFKTSTGRGPRGITLDDIRLIRSILSSKIGLKASGGIRTFEDACRFIEAGADIIGTSTGLNILDGLRRLGK